MKRVSILFAENIKEFCRQKNIRISDIEAGVNVSKGHLSRIRKNAGRIDLDTAIEMAEMCGMTVQGMLAYPYTQRREELEVELAKLSRRAREIKTELNELEQR